MNPVGSSYTFTLSHFHFLASQQVLVNNMMSVESIASFRELKRGSLASKPQHMVVPNQTRQPSGKHAGTVIFNTLVVGMSPVNCLIEHNGHVHNFVVHASQTGGRLVSALVSCRKHASVLLRTVSFRHSCAAYQPPTQGFSHISK